jgi:sporulation protein YlmC with PRC-barrel domain
MPGFTPLTAIGESEKYDEGVTVLPGAKGHSESWRASQVMGVDVKNASDETIGEVKDLVLDMREGEILAVVISSGGFLGIADTLSAVPVSVLRYDTEAKAFKTKLTKARSASIWCRRGPGGCDNKRGSAE